MDDQGRMHYEYEDMVLGLILIDPKRMDSLNLFSELFMDPLNREIFEVLQDVREVGEEFTKRLVHNHELIERVSQLLNSIPYADSGNERSLAYAVALLESWKQLETKELHRKYEHGKITYDEYIDSLNEVARTTMAIKQTPVTRDDLLDAIINNDKGLLIPKYPRLSDALQLKKGDTITFAGKSGYGKSSMLLNIYQDMAKSGKYKCHYFNLEVSPATMNRRLVSIASGVQMNDLKDKVKSKEVSAALDEIANSDSYIYSGSCTVESIKATVMQNKDDDKVNVVFVDHIGLIQTNNKNIRTEYDRVTYAMINLHSFVFDHEFVLIIASQFDRGSIKSGEIGMHSLKSSGEIENSSTHVVIMADSKMYEEDPSLNVSRPFKQYMKYKIEKNRNGQIGIIETYEFDKPTQIIYERKFD